MHQGSSLAFEVVKIEGQLLDSSLKYHYLIAEERLRSRQPSWFANLSAQFRLLLSPATNMREERI